MALPRTAAESSSPCPGQRQRGPLRQADRAYQAAITELAQQASIAA